MTTPTEIRFGDVGTVFQITITDENGVVDLTGVTDVFLGFLSPDGVLSQKEATVAEDPTTGQVEYTIQDGDLSSLGLWRIQAVVTFTTGKWTSDTEIFSVVSVL